MEERLKILAVGCRRGAAFMDVAAEDPGLEPAGLVDTNPERLAETARRFGLDSARCFASLDEALRRVEADVLIVASPTVLHFEHTMAGLRAGLHVLCEKPLTHSRPQALAMRDEARKLRRHLNVVQNARYAPQWRKCRELVASGLIGQVAHIEMTFRRWRQPGGLEHAVLFNHGVHHIDIVRSVLDVEPAWVRAVEWDPPWPPEQGPRGEGFGRCIALTGLATNGCMVSYHASYAETGRVSSPLGDMRIVGSGGVLEAGGYSDFDPRVWHCRLAKPTGQDVEERIPVAALSFREYDRAVLNNLVQAIRTGQPSETDIEDHLKTLEWLFLAREHIESTGAGAAAGGGEAPPAAS